MVRETDARESGFLYTIVREKAQIDLRDMTTEQLKAELANPKGFYPKDMVKSNLDGRPEMPGPIDGDAWRDDAGLQVK